MSMNISLETVIGKGNSGVVFKGYYQDQPCALKHAENCLEENKMIQSLKHENIISSHGMTKYGKKEYMILEYMNKGDLKQFLKENDWSVHEAIYCVLQLAKAIAYLHSKDIIHTDIAARNCLLSQKNPSDENAQDKEKLLTLKLADFGECVHNMNQPSSPRFALKWASPEVLLSGVLSKSSDVWAFGITICEIMINGEQIFPHQDRTEIEKNIKNGKLPEIPEKCPKILKTIIHQCLQPNPKDRPTMGYIARKLREHFYRSDSLETLLSSIAPPKTEDDQSSVTQYADDNEPYYDNNNDPRLSREIIEDVDTSLHEDYYSPPSSRI